MADMIRRYLDRFEGFSGIGIDKLASLACLVVVLLMYVNVKQQIASLRTEIDDVRSAENSVSSLSRTDIEPVTKSAQTNTEYLKHLQTELTDVSNRLQEVGTAVALANQKLTFVENGKAPPADAGKPR